MISAMLTNHRLEGNTQTSSCYPKPNDAKFPQNHRPSLLPTMRNIAIRIIRIRPQKQMERFGSYEWNSLASEPQHQVLKLVEYASYLGVKIDVGHKVRAVQSRLYPLIGQRSLLGSREQFGIRAIHSTKHQVLILVEYASYLCIFSAYLSLWQCDLF